MSAVIKQLTDLNGNKIYPITHSNTVITEGTTLDQTIHIIQNNIDNINAQLKGSVDIETVTTGTNIISNSNLQNASTPQPTSNDNTFLNHVVGGNNMGSIQIKGTNGVSVSSIGENVVNISTTPATTETLGSIKTGYTRDSNTYPNQYPVQLDSNNNAYALVNCPTPTGLSFIPLDGQGGIQLSLTGSNFPTVTSTNNIPVASADSIGILTIGEQNIAGQKSFLNGIRIGYDQTLSNGDNKLFFGDGNYCWIGETEQDDNLVMYSYRKSITMRINNASNQNVDVLKASQSGISITGDTSITGSTTIQSNLTLTNGNLILSNSNTYISTPKLTVENELDVSTATVQAEQINTNFLVANINIETKAFKADTIDLTYPLYTIIDDNSDTVIYPNKVKTITSLGTSITLDLQDEETYDDRCPIYSIFLSGVPSATECSVLFEQNIKWSTGSLPTIEYGETLEINIMYIEGIYYGIWLKY